METIYSYFKKQVVRNSNEIAVFDENRSLTFKQLDRLVDTIAMNGRLRRSDSMSLRPPPDAQLSI